MANSIIKPELWMPTVEGTLKANIVTNAFLNVLPANNAGAIKLPNMSAGTAGTYTPGSTFTPSDVTLAYTTLNINKYVHWAFVIDRVEELQATPELIPAAVTEHVAAMATAVDADVLTLHDQCITANAITGASSAPLDLDTANIYELIVDAGKRLTKANAPLQGRWIVVSPEVHARLLKDKDHFINVADLGNTVVTTARFGTPAVETPGLIGRISSMDVYLSNSLETASSGANIYLMYGQGRPVAFSAYYDEIKVVELGLQHGQVVKQLMPYGTAVTTPNKGRIGSIYVKNT